MSTTAAPSVVAEVKQWLSRFDEARRGEIAPPLPSCSGRTATGGIWWAFTWNLTTVEGRQARGTCSSTPLRAPGRTIGTTAEEPVAANGVSEAWITFDTAVGRGRGYLRLRDGKAWTLLTTLEELTGHEASAGPHRPKGVEHGAIAERRTWFEERSREREELGYTTQPCGDRRWRAGRNRARGAPARTSRPDDHHRAQRATGRFVANRYKSLCLHDPVWYDHLPYIKFPPNRPVFSPRRDRRLARNVHARDGAELLELHRGRSTLATTTSAGSGP